MQVQQNQIKLYHLNYYTRVDETLSCLNSTRSWKMIDGHGWMDESTWFLSWTDRRCDIQYSSVCKPRVPDIPRLGTSNQILICWFIGDHMNAAKRYAVYIYIWDIFENQNKCSFISLRLYWFKTLLHTYLMPEQKIAYDWLRMNFIDMVLICIYAFLWLYLCCSLNRFVLQIKAVHIHSYRRIISL